VVAAAVYDVLPLRARLDRAALINSATGEPVAVGDPALTDAQRQHQHGHGRNTKPRGRDLGRGPASQ